jgi:hypothetical protein
MYRQDAHVGAEITIFSDSDFSFFVSGLLVEWERFHG